MRPLLLLLIMVLTPSVGAAELSHGPVLAFVTPTEATIWVRTAEAGAVDIEYGLPGAPPRISAKVFTKADADFTGTLTLTGLRPATTHTYRVRVDGVPGPLVTFRSAPREGDPEPVAIAVFSDSFRAKPWPGVHAAMAMNPDLALMIGDWDHGNSNSLATSRAMYRSTRGPETPLGADFAASGLQGRVPLAEIWDDHSYCNNNSTQNCVTRAAAMQAWAEYHALPEDTVFPDCIGHRFARGQVEVFMLDVRSCRNPAYSCAGCRSMLGPIQEAWLLNALLVSRDNPSIRWRVLVSPVPFHQQCFKNGDAWMGYPASRTALLEHLAIHQIPNVVVLSGDLHSGGQIGSPLESGVWELNVPLANQGFANTGCGHLTWSGGRYPQSTPGFGWIYATPTALTLSAYGVDGVLRVSVTVPAE